MKFSSLFHIMGLFLCCWPVSIWTQSGYYYVETSCIDCKLTANGKTGRFELISDRVHPFTMGEKEREKELIIAEFTVGLAASYSNYPVLMQKVTVRELPEEVGAEQARQQQISAMKTNGYQVVERPYWLASHRAIPALDDYLSFAAKAGFDGVVLIADNGWIVHRRGYGKARALGELANSPAVVFPVGTMAKAFTAQSILLLQEDGRLDLSDNLGRIFRNSPADKKTITIDQLLTHTAGLARDVLLEGEETSQEVLDAILDSKLEALPGQGFHYSNAGYQLLALIIQKLTRQPYDQFLKEQILAPFQLHHTWFYHQPVDEALIADGRMGGVTQPFSPLAATSYTYLGSDGLLMTADDLFRWFRSLSRLPFFFEMTRHRLDIETSHGFVAYDKMVTASGDAEGYFTHLSYDQSRNRVIILLSNTGLEESAAITKALTKNINKIMDGQPVKWVEEHPVNPGLHPGIYINGQDTLQIFIEDGRIIFLANGRRLIDELSSEKPTIGGDFLFGFAVPTAERELTYFDLVSEQEETLFFAEDFREVRVGELNLKQEDRP